MDTIIVYGTRYGTSLKVAQTLGEQIAGAVELVDVKNIDNIDLDTVDRLIIGCGIKIGKIPYELRTWLNKEQKNIINKELYIYMCAGENVDSKIQELFKANFPKQVLKSSRFTTCVGGEIDLDNMGFLLRLVFWVVKKLNPSIDSLNSEKIADLAKEINKIKSENEQY